MIFKPCLPGPACLLGDAAEGGSRHIQEAVHTLLYRKALLRSAGCGYVHRENVPVSRGSG